MRAGKTGKKGELALVCRALLSGGAAAATAIVSLSFLTPALAMPPLSDTIPDDPAPSPAGAAPGRARRSGGHGRAPAIIRRIDNPDMQVTFTFDACATKTQANGFDRAVLQVLQRDHVPATIFTSGRWVELHPEAMAELTAESLIEFANHSYDHPHMDRLNTQEIAAELDRTEAALGRYGRHSVAFRPPFGDFNQRVLDVAREKRLPAVLWDVVSGDPSAHATAEAMIRSVVRQTRPGSIIIFHINARETKTADALPAIFQQLRTRGFQFVHLSALLARGIPGSPVAARTSAPMAAPAVSAPVAARAVAAPAVSAPVAERPVASPVAARAVSAPVAAPAVSAPVGAPAVFAPVGAPVAAPVSASVAESAVVPVAPPVPTPVAVPARPPVASPSRHHRPEDDGDDVLPPSQADGVSDVNAPGRTRSEASGRQPPRSHSRPRPPTSAASLMGAAVPTRASLTPPPLVPAAASQPSAK
ncbi:MAG: polysaccharide deacetylase family protein [Polyangia bacterium]